MAYKNGVLTIDNFHKGIAPSPLLGFHDMRQLNLTFLGGGVTLSHRLEKKSGTSITGKPIKFIRDDVNGDFWTVDTDKKVYRSTDGGDTWASVGTPTAGGTAGDIAYWKGHILYTNGTALDGYDIAANDAWDTNFAGGSIGGTGGGNPMIVGQDDIVYIGGGNKISSLREKAGQNFNSATSATFTFNATALDIPEDYVVSTLQELDKELLIGTQRANADQPFAYIFPWDRLSQSFRLPLVVNEASGIRSAFTTGGVMYFISGQFGRLYATNGKSVILVKQFPKQLLNLTGGKTVEVARNAMVAHGGKLLIGTTGGTLVADVPVAAVWAYENGRISIENRLSVGAGDDDGDPVRIGCLYSQGETVYWAGWQDAGSSAAQGLDKLSTTNRVTSYGGRADSQFYPIASIYSPKTFKWLEIRCATDLASGEGIKVSYRDTIGDAWTLLATFDFSTYGAVKQIRLPITVRVTDIQIRIELDDGTESTPELMSVILE